MRVSSNQTAALAADMQQSQGAVTTAVNQLASGLRVSKPSDDPTAFAQDLRSLSTSSSVDRYTANAESVVARAQMADSSLSAVITSLNQAVSLGTEGGSGTLTADNRAALATQVQGILSNVLSQANLSFNGTPLFSGTAGTTTPFTADSTAPSGFTYNGDSGVNQTTIGDGLQVATNVPGDQIFLNPESNVLGSLNALSTALTSGSSTDIASATSAVSSAIGHVGQQRVLYSNTVNQADAQESFLSQEKVSLSSQQSSLTGIDLSTAATNLTQAQTANTAILAAAAKVLPVSLLNYLSR